VVQSPRMTLRLLWLLLGGSSLACGGRYIQSGEYEGTQGGSGSSSAGEAGGGKSSQGGKPARGGSGAIPGGAPASGGAPHIGGAAPAGGVAPTGGACGGPIGNIDCISGYRAVYDPVTCQVSCVLDPDACDAGRKAYQMFRAQLLDKYSELPCLDSSECDTYYEQNACSASCGIPINKAALNDLASNLTGYSQMACSLDCPPIPVPPCDPIAVACLNGRCQ
jgi:hypothetical protein